VRFGDYFDVLWGRSEVHALARGIGNIHEGWLSIMWKRIDDNCRGMKGLVDRPKDDDRLFLVGAPGRYSIGISSRNVPKRCGDFHAAQARFQRWAKRQLGFSRAILQKW
jgi:hypothetical protein